jgi:hypothetical protein
MFQSSFRWWGICNTNTGTYEITYYKRYKTYPHNNYKIDKLKVYINVFYCTVFWTLPCCLRLLSLETSFVFKICAGLLESLWYLKQYIYIYWIN